jgi:2-oxoisovalerate dehydrogenase E2 component (dihydrolipoyl transacylase)
MGGLVTSTSALTGTRTFNLPDLGEGLTEADVLRWMVQDGDVIAVDQPMLEVETAKSIVEVPSPFAGRVLILHAQEGQTVQVGQPLVSIGPTTSDPEPKDRTEQADAAAQTYRDEERAGSGNVLIGYGTPDSASGGRRRRRKAARGEPGRTTAPAKDTPKAEATDDTGAMTVPARRPVPRVISPLVRNLAREHGVDLYTLVGTGRGGMITRSDVEKAQRNRHTAADATASTTPKLVEVSGETRIPLTGFRKAVSAALVRSRTEIPEATVWVDVDATPLWELRENARTAHNGGPGILAYLGRFTVAALRRYPVLNARIDTERNEIVQLQSINLGFAVQSERGLVVPSVAAAERLTTTELDSEIRALTARARDGRCSPEELAAGTFTLNNYGSFRVDGSAAIINHPQVAILGFGRIIERPWVVNGDIVARRITQMSFAFDHRVCDGGTASGFMRAVADAIENPAAAIAGL